MKRINLKTTAALLAATGSLTLGGATALAAPAGAIVGPSSGGINICASLPPKLTLSVNNLVGALASGSCFTPSSSVTVSWSTQSGASYTFAKPTSSAGSFSAQVGTNCGGTVYVSVRDNTSGAVLRASGAESCIIA